TGRLDAAVQCSSILSGRSAPILSRNGIAFANQRAEISGIVHGITDVPFAHPLEQQIAEFGKRRTLHQDAQHRDASLARISKASGNAALGSPGKIGITVNDDAGISAE